MTAIVDTGVFFAFYSLRDKHHLDSLALIVHLTEGRWGRPYITSHILDETLNILKYRVSPEAARAFLDAFIDSGMIKVLYLEKELEDEALNVFKENVLRKGFSYTDAVTTVALRKFRIDYLLSFDVRSFAGLVSSIVGPNYWESLPKEEQDRILELVKPHSYIR
ncbi:MAG: PIN domain-containing protein [Desulfurococcales archaeon]|nr:PIN domain-containing protein [Desulfurococcales archaeon]